MAFWQSQQLLYPGPIAAFMEADGANDLIPLFGDFVTPASMANGDIVEMVALPANYVPVELLIDTEALGAATTQADVGLLSGNAGALLDVAGAARTCGNEAFAAGTFSAATRLRPTKKDFGLIAPAVADPTTTPQTTGDRSFGFKFTTLTTYVAGAKVRFTLLCRPKINGV